MNDLPRRDPTPLYPRPGRFEETLRRARRRRQRTGVLAAAALVVVCAGGVSAAMAARNGHHRIDSADINTSAPTIGGNSGGVPTDTTSPEPPVNGQSSPTGGVGSGSGAQPSTTPTEPTNRPSTSGSGGSASSSTSGQIIRGKAVDASGQPLSDIGVYVKAGGTLQRVGHTRPDGSYQIPCTGGQVLLASGDFAATGGPSNKQNYAYTYVNSSDQTCKTPASTGQTMGTTVMDAGGQLSITVTDTSGNPIPGSTEPALYCDASSSAPCYTMVADGSGHYTYSGLATGDYTLRGQSQQQHVYHVTAGQTTTVTWVESQPSSTPTAPSSSAPPDTPSPTPTSDSESPAGTSPQTETTASP